MSGALTPAHCQAILEDLPNGIYVVDTDRKILFWNRGAEQITGYLSQETVGRHCQDNLLMHCDENHVILCGDRCPLRATLSDGRPREAIVYLRHKQGHRIPVRVRAVPVRNENGVIVGAAESFDEQHDFPELQVHPNAQAVHNHLDERTGVSDQASTRQYLEACLRDYAEDHIPFGVLLFALDGLEEFRKSYGQPAGEKAIQTVAATLSKSLRVGDIVGDWTNNRFLALVVNCPAATLAQLAVTLKGVLSSAEIPWWGERLPLRVSVAGAAVRPGDTAVSLLARCESGLAEAARIGGNGVDLL